MKKNFITNAWALRKNDGKFLSIREAGEICDPLGTYMGNDPYLLSTRRDARDYNRNFGSPDLKIIKVQVSIKEVA